MKKILSILLIAFSPVVFADSVADNASSDLVKIIKNGESNRGKVVSDYIYNHKFECEKKDVGLKRCNLHLEEDWGFPAVPQIILYLDKNDELLAYVSEKLPIKGKNTSKDCRSTGEGWSSKICFMPSVPAGTKNKLTKNIRDLFYRSAN